MATITATDMTAVGAVDAVITTLDGTDDTFSYNPGKDPVLVLTNNTAGAISPTITGSAATTVNCDGVGEIDVSTGFAVGSIADGDSTAIRLKSIEAYLKGTIDISSGTGLDAQLLEF